MPQDPLYALLRHLTLPVIAVTTSAAGRRNGMIANSAQRASLVPTKPRISLYISKINFTHDLVWRSGVFAVHLLRTDQWDVVRGLGLRSGRDGDKMEGIRTVDGITGCPTLADCRAAFECRVVNAMDAGAATFFLGDVVQVTEPDPEAQVLTSDYFRANLPDDIGREYEARLEIAQKALEPLTDRIDPAGWPGPSERP